MKKSIAKFTPCFSGFILLGLFETGSLADLMPALDFKFAVIASLVLPILIGVLATLFNLNRSLIYKQKVELGLITEAAVKESLWQIWKEKLTDVVPVEEESSILLDHDYDGIQELDNNLPPWWLYGFYVSIAFGIFYIGYYHYSDYGKSSAEEYEIEMALAQIEVDKYLEKQANNIDESNLIALEDAQSLMEGESLFNQNCIACHMKGGGGSPISVGPNLTDEYWIHGGKVVDVFKTIKYGVPEKGMIAWKTQLKPADIHKLASYIMSIQGTNPPNAKKHQGKLITYVENNQ